MSRTKLTPMMQQYMSIKEKYQDAFLFFRLGDFYELFFEDAIEAARILEITLTSRNRNADNPIPMAGVPHHSAIEYIRRLVQEGHKVAICEQVEDPRQAKGMVKREVVQVITPGTILEESALSSKENNFIASLVQFGLNYGLAYGDLSTGELFVAESVYYEEILNEVLSVRPSELIVDESLSEVQLNHLQSAFQSQYNILNINELIKKQTPGWTLNDASETEKLSLDALVSYIQSVQMTSLEHFQPVKRYAVNQYLQMNYYAKSQLELTKSLRTQRRKGSLLWFLDKTRTAMGGRLLHQWLEKPLLLKEPLMQRHNRVEAFINQYFERLDIIESLKDVYDLERIITKISLKTATVRDIGQLRYSLHQIPSINALLNKINESQNTPVFKLLNPLNDLVQFLDKSLNDDLPISITDGGIIRDGYNQKLDQYRDALKNGEKWLSELQQKERERTGLKTLKIGYNKVFGYYIEMSRHQAQTFEDPTYERKQTLANTERFITPKLKEIEDIILEAQEKSELLEYELFVQIRSEISNSLIDLQKIAKQIAEIDVLTNFANISENENFVRAEITEQSKDIYLKDNRHPVVEKLLGEGKFVPNDFYTDENHYILLLTGPNMSGKSTYMRQIAYSIILNQIGCFVPAKEAKLPLIDKIFTRIGSADDISTGQSTFMVEMMETNTALKNATSSSLLLFDELGRGTATYDGMALAQGIIEYIATHIKATTIFSTHYHELTNLEQTISTLKNIHVGASEHDGKLLFHHRIVDGPADKSYGIHVAGLAGLPQELINNSELILKELEQKSKHSNNVIIQSANANIMEESTPENNTLDELFVNRINELSIDSMTPLEALNVLNDLQKYLKR